MKAKVDKEKCIACGECVEVCPVEAIDIVDEMAEVDDSCNLCGLCVDSCDYEAIDMPEVDAPETEDLESYKGVWIVAEHLIG